MIRLVRLGTVVKEFQTPWPSLAPRHPEPQQTDTVKKLIPATTGSYYTGTDRELV
jgi:hypothetical protein